MIKTYKLFVAVVSVVVILLSWRMVTTVSARLVSEQNGYLETARSHAEKKIYDRSVEAYEDALSVDAGNKVNISYELVEVYKQAKAYSDYRGALGDMISEELVPDEKSLSDLYLEAVNYDLSADIGLTETLALIKEGIEKTESEALASLYEQYRYLFEESSARYDEAGSLLTGVGLVKIDDLFGYVDGSGGNILAPVYELASNMINGSAIVQQGGELFAIDTAGTRQAAALFKAADILSYSGSQFAVQLDEAKDYVLANWQGGENTEITKTETPAEYIGIYNNGIRALKNDSKWALQDNRDADDSVASDYVYEEIAVDEFGRCAVNNSIFIKENGQYFQTDYSGNRVSGPYEEVKMFYEADGLAAVKTGGQWGFINTGGDIVIKPQYQDAESSSMGLASVMTGDLWGYVNVTDENLNKMVIEPAFLGAKQFVDGVAPVKYEDGWGYITLVEYLN